MAMHALITGGAGFIGSHLVESLLDEGWRVTVIDNFDPAYDPAVKRRNLARCFDAPGFILVEADITDGAGLLAQWPTGVDVLVHLAARTGIGPSVRDPLAYSATNIIGTHHVLECARRHGIAQVILASSSSVYGVNPRLPWREDDPVLQPISPYAATKVSGEMLGHVYSRLYGLRVLALRFFTVYGPRQRPDLAVHKFARLLRAGRPIPVYGDGSARRDHTYVGDIVQGIRAAMACKASPYEVINLGSDHPLTLLEMIAALEEALGVTAQLDFQPAQPGDAPHTWADISTARRLLGYAPRTSFPDGLAAFVDWLDGV
jgi:UDP-glucuronate 4-epimerase